MIDLTKEGKPLKHGFRFKTRPVSGVADDGVPYIFSCEVEGGVEPYSYFWWINGEDWGETNQTLELLGSKYTSKVVVEVTDAIGNSISSLPAFLGVGPNSTGYELGNSYQIPRHYKLDAPITVPAGNTIVLEMLLTGSAGSRVAVGSEDDEVNFGSQYSGWSFAVWGCTVTSNGQPILNGDSRDGITGFQTYEITMLADTTFEHIGGTSKIPEEWDDVDSMPAIIKNITFNSTDGPISFGLENKLTAPFQFAQGGFGSNVLQVFTKPKLTLTKEKPVFNIPFKYTLTPGKYVCMMRLSEFNRDFLLKIGEFDRVINHTENFNTFLVDITSETELTLNALPGAPCTGNLNVISLRPVTGHYVNTLNYSPNNWLDSTSRLVTLPQSTQGGIGDTVGFGVLVTGGTPPFKYTWQKHALGTEPVTSYGSTFYTKLIDQDAGSYVTVQISDSSSANPVYSNKLPIKAPDFSVRDIFVLNGDSQYYILRNTLKLGWNEYIKFKWVAPLEAVPETEFIFGSKNGTDNLALGLDANGDWTVAFNKVAEFKVDGVKLPDGYNPYPKDGKVHTIEIKLDDDVRVDYIGSADLGMSPCNTSIFDMSITTWYQEIYLPLTRKATGSVQFSSNGGSTYNYLNSLGPISVSESDVSVVLKGVDPLKRYNSYLLKSDIKGSGSLYLNIMRKDTLVIQESYPLIVGKYSEFVLDFELDDTDYIVGVSTGSGGFVGSVNAEFTCMTDIPQESISVITDIIGYDETNWTTYTKGDMVDLGVGSITIMGDPETPPPETPKIPPR